MPIVVAGAIFILAGAGVGAYFVHQGFGTPNLGKTPAASQAPSPKPAIADSPQTLPAPAPQPAEVQTATSGQSTPAQQIQPVASVAAIPSAGANPVPPEPRKPQTPATSSVTPAPATVAKPSEAPASRSHIFSNLKMTSPSSPARKPSNPGADAAPIAEITTQEGSNGTPSSALLSSVARTPNAPAPPVNPSSAPAARKMVDAKLISSARPVYPEAARVANIQGNVLVSATVNEKGAVVAAKVISGPMILRQAALESVKRWKYSPATIDGKPLPSDVTVNVVFRLR